MTPEQFLSRIAKQPLSPMYLFLGPEGYFREVCRTALINAALAPDAREEGVTRVDLEYANLSEVLDDARSLSLFASDRVVWVSSAELALPRRLTSDDSHDGGSGSPIAAYLRSPTPGTTIVLDCSRYDFSGDDKPKLERVQKFYSEVPATVEFRPLDAASAHALGQQLAAKHKLKLGGGELAVLLDAVAGDATRLGSEIEKLSLFVGTERAVTMDDLRMLVPNAAQSTIFSLVAALGKGDRPGALKSLDILIREGEYLPLALTFLSGQFRLALAAKEARITTTQQAQAHFTKLGVRIWRERAEQVIATASIFSAAQLSRAVSAIYDTDKKFRDGLKDDRIVMEGLVLALTKR